MIAPASAEIVDPTFILNGHSVRVEEARAHIARISSEFGVPTRVVVTRRGDDISSLAARAASENRRPVVAGGGDGTVNAVAGTLTGTGGATDQELNAFETEEVWVRPDTPRVNVSTDGEVSLMNAPLHYRIRPRALQVVVPPQKIHPVNQQDSRQT